MPTNKQPKPTKPLGDIGPKPPGEGVRIVERVRSRFFGSNRSNQQERTRAKRHGND